MFYYGKKFGESMPIGFGEKYDLFRTYMDMQTKLGFFSQKFNRSYPRKGSNNTKNLLDSTGKIFFSKI